MKEISVKALAKVNLGLDVVRKREDGYHESVGQDYDVDQPCVSADK